MSAAVAYTATDGYLFQTVVSAVQARSHTRHPVYLCHFGAASAESRAFEEICNAEDIVFISAPTKALQGLGPLYSRFFLDAVLPADADVVLYLDGDTQIVGDLDPLLDLDAPQAVLAARDPMVLIRQVHRRRGLQIDGWWDEAGIPLSVRTSYVNAGVMRLDRGRMADVRRAALATLRQGSTTRFQDQDALNTALGGSIGVVSSSWNFPGFLLGTPLVEVAPPKIIHFMSSPRPWDGPFAPWGHGYYAPYERFAARHPAARAYWRPLGAVGTLRYRLQHTVKSLTERRQFASADAQRVLTGLETSTLV